jgi:hypothetical protein
MKRLAFAALAAGGVLLAVFSVTIAGGPRTAGYKVLGWNDLGMHCVDGNDYSVFSILPPYNNIHAQVIDPNGKLVKSASALQLTYHAVADPEGLINRTSAGKTNFWQYVEPLFGVRLANDVGLAGQAMPGAGNTPQPMRFDSQKSEWVAEGVPVLPYPDNPPAPGAKHYYPLMRIAARDLQGRVLATADVVLPVSDEMACSGCHSSATIDSRAMPSRLAYDPSPDRDYKLNILQLHDDRHNTNLMARQPVLCASCHPSNALGTAGTAKPLTQAIHARHAEAVETGQEATRAACYRCHPGSETKCLRGAMGNAGMQCQNCHGSMSEVGAAGRKGWLDEPSCENCHTGTAVRHAGQIRFTDAFAADGRWRQPADTRFAVNSGKLYRLSTGHGKLACEACHGSTHAEYPSSHANDNLLAVQFQGHAGTISECASCHGSKVGNLLGGPHGMHPANASWVDKHGDLVEHQGNGACRDCHGGDLRGTVLSAALAARAFQHDKRTYQFAKGAVIGCWSCHNGPNP